MALVLGATAGCGGPATAASVEPAPQIAPASSEVGASETVRIELAAAGIEELDTVDGLLVDQLGGSVCRAWGAGVRQDAVVGLIGEAYSTLTDVEAIRVSAAISKAYCPPS